MAVQRSKDCIATNVPLQRTTEPKKWYKHEYEALDNLVSTTHELPDVPCVYHSKTETYTGGTLRIGVVHYKSPLSYVFAGTFDDREVVIKAGFAVRFKNRPYDTSPRVRMDGILHAQISKNVGSEDGIPRFHGYWHVGSYAFYVVERIEQDLYTRIRSTTPDLETVKDWGGQLLGILKCLHIKGEHIHMDIKPSNVVIDSSGKLYLIDLEVARTTRLLVMYGHHNTSSWESEIGSGTKRYKSIQAHHPRLALPGYYSDIQSLVIMLEEILCEGVLPWDDMEEEETYQCKLTWVPKHELTRRLWEYTCSMCARDIPEYDLLIEYMSLYEP